MRCKSVVYCSMHLCYYHRIVLPENPGDHRGTLKNELSFKRIVLVFVVVIFILKVMKIPVPESVRRPIGLCTRTHEHVFGLLSKCQSVPSLTEHFQIEKILNQTVALTCMPGKGL